MRILDFELIVAVSALLLVGLAQAGQVTGPNGEYKESHTDLSVKVLGGAVSVERSWLNGRWYVNPAWADLRFTYDALDGSVKTIDRAGSVFEGSGEVFVFDDRFFVRKTTQEVNGETASGWRWSNTGGDWVDYDADGKIVAYGDRHDVSVRFVRNGDGLISAVRDDRDALVLSMAYTNGQPTTITDRAGRSVSYTWTGTNLSSVQYVLGHVGHVAGDQSALRPELLLRHRQLLAEMREGARESRAKEDGYAGRLWPALRGRRRSAIGRTRKFIESVCAVVGGGLDERA